MFGLSLTKDVKRWADVYALERSRNGGYRKVIETLRETIHELKNAPVVPIVPEVRNYTIMLDTSEGGIARVVRADHVHHSSSSVLFTLGDTVVFSVLKRNYICFESSALDKDDD